MDSGIDETLYDSETPQKPDSKAQSVDEEEAMNPTTLVDLKVLTGKDGVAPKVGEERVVKVTAIHGDQAEISYAPEKPDESEGKATESDPEMTKLNSEY
jgi:RecJ-like exonuclease